MNITKISTNQAESYFPREIKVDNLKKNMAINDNSEVIKLSTWQKDVLTNAIDKLLNNIQLDNSHPLGRLENQPIETYREAIAVLEEMSSESLRNFGSQAQANVSAESFLNLVMEA
ncbi:hypothetical protein MASR1M45_25180 [Candidatus Kapaibacterium sp.]